MKRHVFMDNDGTDYILFDGFDVNVLFDNRNVVDVLEGVENVF